MALGQKNPINFDDDLNKKKKKAYFKRAFPAFKKKATELSILCGNSVGFICYGPENDVLHVWPEPEKNPQAIPQIVSQFNRQSDRKRNNHACHLDRKNIASEYSLADLEGLSVEELKRHLAHVNAHLVGVRQKKTTLLFRNSKSSELKPNGTKDHHHLRVSDSIADEVYLPENRTTTLSGFDELSCVVRGFNEISDKNVVGLSGMEADSPPLDLVTLGSYGGDSLEYSSTLPPLITCQSGDQRFFNVDELGF